MRLAPHKQLGWGSIQRQEYRVDKFENVKVQQRERRGGRGLGVPRYDGEGTDVFCERLIVSKDETLIWGQV